MKEVRGRGMGGGGEGGMRHTLLSSLLSSLVGHCESWGSVVILGL